MRYSTLLLVALLLIGTSASAFEREFGEHYFSFGGFVNMGNSFRLTGADSLAISTTIYEPPTVLLQQNQLRLELGGSHPGEVYTQLNLDLVYTSSPEHPFTDDASIEIDEAYVDFRWRDIDWRIGREKVMWGKSDLVSPFDTITGRNVRDPFVNQTIEDRIGQWGARATYSWGDFSLDALFCPIWSASSTPEAETILDDQGFIIRTDMDAWFPPIGIYPSFILELDPFDQDPNLPPYFVVSSTYNRTVKPEKNLESATFGTKLNMIRGDWDTDFFFISSISSFPHPIIDAEFGQSVVRIGGQDYAALQFALTGNMEHSRVNSIGAGTATTWGRLAFRAEAGFSTGAFWYRLYDLDTELQNLYEEYLQFGYGSLRDTGAEHSSFKFVFGGDIDIPNTGIFTSNQLVFNKGTGYRDVYFQDVLEVSMSNMVRKTWQDDHLSVSVADLVNFTGGSVWLRPSVSYTLPNFEDLQLNAALSIFTGEEFSLVGQYGDHSALVLSGRLYF